MVISTTIEGPGKTSESLNIDESNRRKLFVDEHCISMLADELQRGEVGSLKRQIYSV